MILVTIRSWSGPHQTRLHNFIAPLIIHLFHCSFWRTFSAVSPIEEASKEDIEDEEEESPIESPKV